MTLIPLIGMTALSAMSGRVAAVRTPGLDSRSARVSCVVR